MCGVPDYSKNKWISTVHSLFVIWSRRGDFNPPKIEAPPAGTAKAHPAPEMLLLVIIESTGSLGTLGVLGVVGVSCNKTFVKLCVVL